MACADYSSATARILQAADAHEGLAVTALAVHGLTEAMLNVEYKSVLSRIDLVLPDGQPVKYCLNSFYQAGLRDRVYGPELMRTVCSAAQNQQKKIYLYGSTLDVLADLKQNLLRQFPKLQICGAEASVFRHLSADEEAALAQRMIQAEADLVFVGLGCPRQERFAARFKDRVAMPVICVGAAFDFLSQHKPTAPRWMQKRGLEWLFRLYSEPRRLWRRYLFRNTYFVFRYVAHHLGLSSAKKASGASA